MINKKTFHSIIAILFILSGATGLIYQIVWFKYLSLFLGNTTYAQTIVLATFMGGLAIGAVLWGRKADTLNNPIMLYAILELGIAVYCFFYPVLLGLAQEFFFYGVRIMNVDVGSSTLLFLKLLASISVLIFPTVLMGGTLPVLVKGITNSIKESGKSVATLYFLNSFGAVVGSLLGGFFLIRLIGLNATITSTAILNAGIGFIALFLSMKDSERNINPSNDPDEESGESFTRFQVTVALCTASISGLVSMIYEVSWVRMLTPVFGSSTYSFSLMLVSFISGITLGSWIISHRISSMKNSFSVLAWCQFGIVIAMIASLPLYGRIPYLFWQISTLITRSYSTYSLYLTFQFVFCFFIMILPTIFLGMSLPVASHITSRSLKNLGKNVGTIFSINTLGTVIGSLLAGLLLIPYVGIQRTFGIALGLNAGLGFFILFNDKKRTVFDKVFISIIIAVSCSMFWMNAQDWNQLMFNSGVFRKLVRQNITPPNSFKEFVDLTNQRKDLYYKEGASATVGVTRTIAAGKLQNILIINGKPDASSIGDLPTQVLVAQFPLIFSDQCDSVLLVGLGSGITAGSILTHDVRSVDCIEISPEVIDASHYFEDVNGKPLLDRRFNLFLEDAHAFLNMTDHKYNVIISEPSNPWIAGIGNLYSTEFFKKCGKKLKDNGLMIQWFHLYEMDDEIFKLVLRTFVSEFPHATVWHSLKNDVLLIGSKNPLELNFKEIENKILSSRVNNDLHRIGVTGLASLLSMQSMSEKQTHEYAGYGQINTEDKPYLEYYAPRSFFASKGVEEYKFYDERTNIRSEELYLSKYIKKHPLSSEEKFAVAQLHANPEKGEPLLAYSLLSELHTQFPKNTEIVLNLADVAKQMGKNEESAALFEILIKQKPNDLFLLSQYAMLKYSVVRSASSYLHNNSVVESEDLFKRCIQLSKDTVDLYHIQLAEMYFASQRFEDAAIHFNRALDIRQRYFFSEDAETTTGLILKLSKAYYYSDNLPKALEFAAHASVRDSLNEEIKNYIYKIAMHQLQEQPAEKN